MPEISEDRLVPRPGMVEKGGEGGIEIDPSRVVERTPIPAWKQNLAAAYRPALEIGGLVGGGVLGLPTAPVSGPAGPAIIAAGGYVIGKNAADALDGFLGVVEPTSMAEEIREMPGELAEGMAYELVAPVIKVTGQGIYKLSEAVGLNDFFRGLKTLFPGLSDSAILKKARSILSDIRAGNFGEQTKESEKILKELKVKTQPTFAQKTGSTKAASFEHSAAAKDTVLKTILLEQDAKISNEAVQYIQKLHSTGASVDDIVSAVSKQKAGLEASAKQAEQSLAEQLPGLTQTSQATGLALKEKLVAGKKAARGLVGIKYDKVPDVVVQPGPIRRAYETVIQDIKLRRGDKSTIPSGMMNQIKTKLGIKQGQQQPPGFVASLPPKEQEFALQFQKLRAWSSEVGEEIRAAETGLQPNLVLARRLHMLEDGIKETMDDLLKMGHKFPEAVKRLKEAHKFFIESYLRPFREGTVAEVLQKGHHFGGSKIPYGDIPIRFFRTDKLDAADDLIRALGSKEAGRLIGEFAEGQFVAKATPGGQFSVSKAAAWIKNNKTVLERYGLLEKFQNITRTGRVAAHQVAKAKAYEQTMAKTILRADPEKLFGEIFTKKSSGFVMKELLDLPGIKGNEAAINGIKTEFAGFLMRQGEKSGVDMLGKPIQSLAKAQAIISKFTPALKILYKNEPEKVAALLNYHKLLQLLARNKSVTYSLGSTTAEKLVGSKTVISGLFAKAAQMAAVMKQRGWIFSSAKNLFLAMWRAPQNFSNTQVEAILNAAIYSPNIAETIMMASHSGSSKLITQRMNTHLAALSAYAAHKSFGALLEENK